ncbi:MAG TPA: TraR/DksA C4-type zinc finger protein [Chthonomonadaceae bacterium]|nr:TraR/DksA C4-type zinc finger protein [Chthonomonadaceae bacterium]
MTPQRTDIDLSAFQRRLIAERRRIAGVYREDEADVRAEDEDASENELSRVTTFDSAENADTAAAIVDHDRETVLDENARQLVHEIDHALDRIADGTYGICEVTGVPIPIERLEAIPWATMTVEAASRADK